MADDQASQNDVEEENDAIEIPATVGTSTAAIQDAVIPPGADYPDESSEDYVVKLIVDEAAGIKVTPDLVNGLITDQYGNIVTTKATIIESINGYTTAMIEELNSNNTAVTGGKGWWGWSTTKLIIVGLIALCILAAILGILFFVIGKKFKKNKRPPTAGGTTTAKPVVAKGVSQDPKYHQVPNV